MLRADVDRPKPQNGSYLWVTAGDTYFSCLPSLANGTGEGFLAVTKEGTKYWFNHMAQYQESQFSRPSTQSTTSCGEYSPLSTTTPSATGTQTTKPGSPKVQPMAACTRFVTIDRRKNVLYPTRIEDRFGNWVTLTYSNASNQPVRLTRIAAHDGRSLSVQHNGNGQISSVSDGSRNWTYAYNGTSLSRVSLPDGSAWTIGFDALTRVEMIPTTEDGGRTCTSPQVFFNDDTVGTITSPSGANGTFTVMPIYQARSNVPLVCTNWTHPSNPRHYPSDDHPLLPYRFASLALKSRVVNGPGLPTSTWSYSFGGTASWKYPQGSANTPTCTTTSCLQPTCLSDSCAGTRTATVTEPDGSRTVRTFGNSYRYNEGKLLSQRTFSPSGAVLREVANTYDYALSGQPYSARIGTSPRPFGDAFTAEYPRPLVATRISQQGADFNWRVNTDCVLAGRFCLDTLLRPTSVTVGSTLAGSPQRLEQTEYHDHPGLWVLGQRKRHIVNGLVAEEQGFDASWALPVSQRRFGRLDMTLGWDTSADVSSGQRGTLRTVTDGRGYTTTLQEWSCGVPRRITHPDSSTQSALVNAQGWIVQTTDENGFVTGYTHDAMGRLTRLTPPGGFAATTRQFWQSGSPQFGLTAGHWVLTESKGGAVTNTLYDALWRPVMVRTEDANAPSTTRSVVVKGWDYEGKPTFQSYPQRDFSSVGITSPGQRTWHDALGRPVRTEADSELGVLTSTTEFLPGFQTRMTNARGFATTQAFWALNNPDEAQLAALSAPEGVNVNIARDLLGKPLSISRGGVTRQYVYNAAQQLCKTIEPESGATVQAYDAAGNLAWRAPGQPLPSTSSCDEASVPTAARISHTYDARNRLWQTNYGDGSPSVTRSYWLDGALATVHSDGSSWSYQYNPLRQVTQESLTLAGQTYTVQRVINANGHLATLSYPGSSLSFSLAPNALGQPTQVGPFATGVQYHPNGAVASYTLGNKIAHSSVQNLRGLPLQLRDAGVVQDLINYDANGNVSAITDQQEAGLFSRSMGYDGLDRLTQANAPGVWGTGRYTYDAADNLRTSQVGSRSATHSYGSNNLITGLTVNGVTTGYWHDARGNLSSKGGQSFGFDLGNRLRSTSAGGQYTYDGHGRRTRVVSTDGSTRVQVYTQDGRLMWSASSGGPRPAGTTAFVHLGTKLIAELDSVQGWRYVHTDALGSPVARTNDSGALVSRTRYEPYGGVAAGAKPGPVNGLVGFTGHVQDPETDLVYMQQRYYDPIAGRFLSVDPVTTNAKTGDFFGRYHYANNNPYKFVDPDGRAGALAACAAGPVGCAAGVVVTVASVARTLLAGAAVASIVTNQGSTEGPAPPDPKSGSEKDPADKSGELTKAGRGQQTHGDRAGSAFEPATGTPADKNVQGQKTLDSIVGSPDKVQESNGRGGTDVRESPDGRGARFDDKGKFTGFIEPRRPQ